MLITLYDRFQQEHLACFPAVWSNVEMPRYRRRRWRPVARHWFDKPPGIGHDPRQ